MKDIVSRFGKSRLFSRQCDTKKEKTLWDLYSETKWDDNQVAPMAKSFAGEDGCP